MATGGSLSSAFGWLVGTGPGAGMGLMFACTCILGTLTCLIGYLIPAVRDVDREALQPGMSAELITPQG
jgi:hypothetical protein